MIQQKVKKRPVLKLIFSTVQSKITGFNKMGLLRNLAMLKCESRISLHAAATI